MQFLFLSCFTAGLFPSSTVLFTVCHSGTGKEAINACTTDYQRLDKTNNADCGKYDLS